MVISQQLMRRILEVQILAMIVYFVVDPGGDIMVLLVIVVQLFVVTIGDLEITENMRLWVSA